MIVPFMFGVEDDPLHYLWVFYKYMDFCVQNKFPIISQESYFEFPSKLKEIKPFVFENIKNGYNEQFEFNEPTDQNMKKLKKYPITKEEENLIFKKYKNKHIAFVDLMEKRNKDLEKLIQKKIDEIEKKEKKKINIILTWIWFPSLEYICKKNKIEVIAQEQSTIRKNPYNCYLGYNCFTNKYESKTVNKNYQLFSKEKHNFFSQKELLALFLKKENLNYLKDKEPIYDFGIDLGMDKDAYFDANSKYKHSELINKCLKLVSKDKIIGRTHPMRPSKDSYEIMDDSKNSIEWILKCRRIVSTVSNIGFEAMLYGKTSYILGDNMPFSLGSINSLDYLDDKKTSIIFLNFIIFGYFSPFELMFNKKYLSEYSSKTIDEIYDINMNYILKKYNLSNSIFSKNQDDRIKEILIKVHGFNKNEAEKFLVSLTKTYEEENEEIKNELKMIKNSRGWKLIEKIRKIRG